MAQMRFVVLAVVLVVCVFFNSCNAHHMEEQCAKQGGICILEDDCDIDQLTSTKGLCPETQSLGYECCYGISNKENRCSFRGGECFAKASCGNAPVDSLANDCAEGEVCCILL